MASLFTAFNESCVITAITQILGAAQRCSANQRMKRLQVPDTATKHCRLSNLLGVVLFVPHIDLLLNRIPTLACHHLIDRLTEIRAVSDRLVLVATTSKPQTMSTCLVGEQPSSPVGKTTPLSIRLPLSSFHGQFHVYFSSSVSICINHWPDVQS